MPANSQRGPVRHLLSSAAGAHAGKLVCQATETCAAAFDLGINGCHQHSALAHLKQIDVICQLMALDRQDASHDITVACDELGGGCHADVSSQVQRALEHGRQYAVVHYYQRSHLHNTG